MYKTKALFIYLIQDHFLKMNKYTKNIIRKNFGTNGNESFQRLPASGAAQRGPVEWDIVLKAPPWLGYNTTPRRHRDDGEVSAVVLPHCVQQQCAPWLKIFRLVLVLSTSWSCQDISTLPVVLNGADTTHCHQRDVVKWGHTEGSLSLVTQPMMHHCPI